MEVNKLGREVKLSQSAIDKLQEFESQLDPANPESGPHSPYIIGFGEMSTVFGFGDSELTDFAFKRMAIFHSEDELVPYRKNFIEYCQLLVELNINMPDYGTVTIERKGQPVLYVFQRKIDSDSIGHHYIQKTSVDESTELFKVILEKFDIVFNYNKNNPKLAIGLDGQISNWVYQNKTLLYLDTSTPLMRKDGIEQLNSELFLRICPSYLVWVIRLFFLATVLDRYYDLRLVIIDLIGNLYKEKKQSLINPFLEVANQFLTKSHPELKPIKQKEIDAYYKEDAWIWRIFLFFRKLERFIKTKIQRREYELILPGNIDR
ncbi:MAG: hypothetical protein H3C43_08000 [Leptonema sp. (in: Bacteria)]|nr:hypothetical protein [Leptonema sp. (in: bacteria)]